MQLANIGFEFGDFSLPPVRDILQHLDLWTGIIHSQFAPGQAPVEVTTVAHPNEDLVAFRIRSKLSSPGQIKLKVRLPAPTGLWKDAGDHWFPTAHHQSGYSVVPNGVDIFHQLDTMSYRIQVRWKGEASFSEKSPDNYIIQPRSTKDFQCSIRFVPVINNSGLPSFAKTLSASKKHWKSFWMSGGAIDFSGCIDPRAFELERRAILSQYLTRIQCASDQPPQETGLLIIAGMGGRTWKCIGGMFCILHSGAVRGLWKKVWLGFLKPYLKPRILPAGRATLGPGGKK